MENTQAQLPWEWCYVQGQAPLLVLPAPDLDKDLTNCVQYTLSAKPPRISAKKGRNLQRIPGLKGLPVIMANGSNLVGGVNELVPSIDVADWHSLSPRTII